MKLYSRQYIQKIDDERNQMNARLIPSGGYIILWQVVTKVNSLSTLVRLVMNAASLTPLGTSLNDILARGENVVASLFSTLVNFRLGGAALSADITKFYNQTRLDPSFLQFQQNLWLEDWLAEGGEELGERGELKSVKMVVKTLIYGLRPSRQRCAINVGELAKYAEEQQPKLAAVKVAYVDDVVTSTVPGKQQEWAVKIADVLAYRGMEVKGFAISGKESPAELSTDGETVGVLGYVWSPRLWTLSVPRESKLTLVHPLIFSLRILRYSRNEIFSLCLSTYSTHLVCTAQVAC